MELGDPRSTLDALIRERGSDYTSLSRLGVSGVAMAPAVADGDEILVDRGDAGEGLRDGIYVLRIDDALVVKRIALDPAGGFDIRSDNPAAAGGAIAAAAAQIIGRVLWFGRSLR